MHDACNMHSEQPFWSNKIWIPVCFHLKIFTYWGKLTLSSEIDWEDALFSIDSSKASLNCDAKQQAEEFDLKDVFFLGKKTA